MPFAYDKDDAGIVTVTMDMDGQSANTMNSAYRDLMKATVERLERESGLTGVVIASAKKTFFAGGDLHALLAQQVADEAYFAYAEENKGFLRRLERLTVPVVAAINGAALGGGYEICLACNRRIALDDPSAVTGLPEVTLGLLPGAGGVVRAVALLGLETALPVVTEGRAHGPRAALALGMIDAVVARRDDLIPAAKAWIAANPGAFAQPWDLRGFAYPGGGASDPKVRMLATLAPTLLIQKTRGLAPAPARIIDVAVNSMRMGFDSALRNETRQFLALVATPEAKAGITTNFFAMNALKSGAMRPPGPVWAPRSAAVLGAGMPGPGMPGPEMPGAEMPSVEMPSVEMPSAGMIGAGIAFAHAARGLATVLVGGGPAGAVHAHAHAHAAALCAARRMDGARTDALLGLIRGADASDPGGVDIAVETTGDDLPRKERRIADTFGALAPGGIYGIHTSALSISVLAAACADPSRVIGIHFFGPVETSRAVEIILGAKTSAATAAKAYDYVRAIGKIPIVVTDGRGFFAPRVRASYFDEGQALVRDGMEPAMIERAAWKIGMAAGPLMAQDDATLIASMQLRAAHLALDARLGVANGDPVDTDATRAVGHAMAGMGRGGRGHGGGFYDHAPDGTAALWPGLAQFAARTRDVSMREAEDRLLYRVAIETLRCLDEGVLRGEAEGNIASILALGFAPHTGGALQFIRGIGIDAFAARAAELADACGPRFAARPAALDALRAGAARAA
jgi:3-hydroxyacyl-CoA dehydrogenase/enoyl-CoA hydratase/3-hydroxybutyryl-CoA epimerase